MSTHTPGPWEIGRTRGNKIKIYSVCPASNGGDWANWWVATPLSARPTERDANARLIAAAPDLLAACKAFVHWYNVDSTEYNRDDAFASACAAIAKAEGK